MLEWGAAPPVWGLPGCGQRKDKDKDTNPPRQSWPRRGGLYLTHVHKYSSEGEAGGEGALPHSRGSRAGHVRGVLREPRMGLPRREVRWFPLVIEGMVGILHASRGVFGVQRAWGWWGVPVLPCGTSGHEGRTPLPS